MKAKKTFQQVARITHIDAEDNGTEHFDSAEIDAEAHAR